MALTLRAKHSLLRNSLCLLIILQAKMPMNDAAKNQLQRFKHDLFQTRVHNVDRTDTDEDMMLFVLQLLDDI